MSNPNLAVQELQNLMRANFERMVAFEQAAFNAGSSELKVYFEDKASESEKNINELNDILYSLTNRSFDVENEVASNLLGTAHLFTGQKNINIVLKHLQYLEKAVMKWYKKGMSNLKGISQNANSLLTRHYSDLQVSHLYVQNC